ncbi:MAG: hydantoinase/oxoprolinase family protein [Pseudomonadota bacterium]
MAEAFFGWDIGGAHLKVAHVDRAGSVTDVRVVASPLWRGLDELERAIGMVGLAIDAPGAAHAITMTGELCDVFKDRREGVQMILAKFLPAVANAEHVRIFAGYSGWLSVDQEVTEDRLQAIASANWLALGAFASELVADGVLIDVGSTTTDIVPLKNGELVTAAQEDATRLAARELAYTGVVRTPIMAVCREVPFKGNSVPIASESFASMGDVYRLLDQLHLDDDLMETADGRGKDIESSAARIARMLGQDYRSADLGYWRASAAAIADEHFAQLLRAFNVVLSRLDAPPPILVGAGIGSFLVKRLAAYRACGYQAFGELIEAPQSIQSAITANAPAVAVARLAWMTT